MAAPPFFIFQDTKKAENTKRFLFWMNFTGGYDTIILPRICGKRNPNFSQSVKPPLDFFSNSIFCLENYKLYCKIRIEVKIFNRFLKSRTAIPLMVADPVLFLPRLRRGRNKNRFCILK
ncbi:MAG TPA: hypothetical protein DC013_10400 [Ruminococcaceae bacterium]|nr:hypothetical protein [Oscillospiraceae bacterium]